MPAAMLLGAIVGLGMLAVARGLTGHHPPLVRALAGLDRPRPPADSAHTPVGRVKQRLARRLVAQAETAGVDARNLAADLRIAERSVEQHMLAKLGAAVALGSLPPLGVLGARLGGVDASMALPVLPGLVLTVVGFVVPDLDIRSRAKERREEFRHTLTSYLDLVAILLAGGAGTETALYSAAELGQGWGFTQLREALDRCRLTGETPWQSLARLGEELDVADLGELAATTGLAGEQGARVRESLAARAVSMRATQLAELEAHAEAATERMTLPMVVLAFAFVLFIGFPAVQQILGGL
ncbi:MAG: hypothetical protein GEV12_21885 [Micromonosporaceae bacterium]|nr:hypothetical protein [Micromonosporaceae bacterium]